MGMLGNILVYLVIFFCNLSRILAISFCIIFSPCFPDIPYYLYELSNAGVSQDEITPYAREIFYMTDISLAPEIFVMIVVVVYPFIYHMLMKHYLLPSTDDKPSQKIQWRLAMTNIFGPVKPRLDFAAEINDWHNILINGTIFILFFLTNVLFLMFALLWYGTSFFTKTLPVLDELIRIFRFKNHSHSQSNIICPASSCACFLIGTLLFIFYQQKFHLSYN